MQIHFGLRFGTVNTFQIFLVNHTIGLKCASLVLARSGHGYLSMRFAGAGRSDDANYADQQRGH